MFKFPKIKIFTAKERLFLAGATAVFLLSAIFWLFLWLEKNSQTLPKAGGEYREGLVGQPILLNPILTTSPLEKDIISLLYVPLTKLLADYQIEENGRIYNLKLKEDLFWSDGQTITTDDIIFSIKLIQNPNLNSFLLKSWQGVEIERISKLRLKFILKDPYIFFMDILANLYIIPKHIFEKIPPENLFLSDYNLKPIGNGPFKFSHFLREKGGFITEYHLKINENYFGQKPYLSKFIFKFYENEEKLINAFNKKSIDGFGLFSPFNFDKIKIRKEIKEFITPYYYAIFLNEKTAASLRQKNIRQALTESIDRKKIIENVFWGKALEVKKPLSLFHKIPSRLPSPALSEQGLIEQELKFSLVVPEIDFLIETGKIIKDLWQDLNIELNLIILPLEEIKQAVRSRDYEMLLLGINPGPNIDLFPFWHSSNKFYPGLNLSLYSNPLADKLMEEIRQEIDREKREKKLNELLSLIKKDQPAIFLFSPKYFYLTTPRLGGFEDKFINTPSLRFKNIEDWHTKTIRVLR